MKFPPETMTANTTMVGRELRCHIRRCSPVQCATLATTNQQTICVGHPYQSYDVPLGDAHMHSIVCHSSYTTNQCITPASSSASLH